MNILPCQIKSEGDSIQVIPLAADVALPWTAGADALPPGWEGTTRLFDLGLRPEAIAVQDDSGRAESHSSSADRDRPGAPTGIQRAGSSGHTGTGTSPADRTPAGQSANRRSPTGRGDPGSHPRRLVRSVDGASAPWSLSWVACTRAGRGMEAPARWVSAKARTVYRAPLKLSSRGCTPRPLAPSAVTPRIRLKADKCMPTSLRDISGFLVGSISIRIVILSDRRSGSAWHLCLNKFPDANAEYFVASKSVVAITSSHRCILPGAGNPDAVRHGGCRKP